jgi:hypothetical protein
MLPNGLPGGRGRPKGVSLGQSLVPRSAASVGCHFDARCEEDILSLREDQFRS